MKNKNIDIVVQNIINMLETNYPYKTDGIAESFVAWCENGNIFHDTEFFVKEDTKELEQVMWAITPYIDALTNKLYELYDKGE